MNSGTTCTEIAVADRSPGAPHARNHLRGLGLLAGQRSAGAARHCGGSHLATTLLTCPRVLTSRPHACIEHQESGYAAHRAPAVSVLPHCDDRGLVRRPGSLPRLLSSGSVHTWAGDIGLGTPAVVGPRRSSCLPAVSIVPPRWRSSPAESNLVLSTATAASSALHQCLDTMRHIRCNSSQGR